MRFRLCFAAILGVALLALSGCGNANDPQTTGQSSSDRATLSHLATEYVTAVFSAKVDAAKELVAPTDQAVLQEVMGSVSIPKASIHNMNIGDVRIHGNKATVVYLGKICSTEPGSNGQCATNADPASTDPGWTVDFALVNGEWKVVFNKPSGTVSTKTGEVTVGPATPSSTADDGGGSSSN